MCKKIYSWNRAICKNGKYLRSIIDNSVIMCDEINIVGNVSTTVTSNMPTNFKMDYYILHMVLLLTMLLLEIGIIFYHSSKCRSKRKNALLQKQYKIENNESEKVSIKSQKCYFINQMTNFQDIDLDSISLYENKVIIFWFMIFYVKLYWC